MKFKPLEFVTNTFGGPPSSTAALADNADSQNNHQEPNTEHEEDSPRVRFELPSSPSDSDSEPDSQFFVLNNKPQEKNGGKNNGRTNPKQRTNVGFSKDTETNNDNKHSSSPNTKGNRSNSAPNTKIAAKTPSPEKSLAKKISPQGVTPSTEKRSGDNMSTDQEKGTPQSRLSNKKKRLSVYEQLAEDTNSASEQWKEYTDAALRFKKQIHKEKLREIKEKEDDLKRLQDHLNQLRKKASQLEEDIQKDIEQKKSFAKLGNNLKRLGERVAKRATKDKEDSRANLKAKDTLLKQARRDAKRAAAAAAAEAGDKPNGSAKKKRKVSPDSKKQNGKKQKRSKDDDDESSDDDDDAHRNDFDSDDSDSDDSDWEGGPKRKTRKGAGEEDSNESTSDAAGSRNRRQTRVRASQWKCSMCTLDNAMEEDECAACGAPRPGAIPDF